MPSPADVGYLMVIVVVILPTLCSFVPWWEFTGEITLGIDLGTTYSVGSICMSGRPEAVRVARNESLVPSMVSYHAAPPGVGLEAEDLLVDYPLEVLYAAKRFIGRKYDDPEVQLEIPEVPFKVHAGKDGEALFTVNGVTISPEDVGSQILLRVKQSAEKSVGYWKSFLGFKFFTATVSVPVSFDGLQRAATHRAGKLAGFSMIRLIEEPVAAATAYATLSPTKFSDVIVYDMGGGTLDVALLTLQDDSGSFSIVSTSGDARLGGSDFDRCLLNYVVAQHLGEGKNSKAEIAAFLHDMDSHERARLTKTVEVAKRKLSSEPSTQFTTLWGEVSWTNGDLKEVCTHLMYWNGVSSGPPETNLLQKIFF